MELKETIKKLEELIQNPVCQQIPKDVMEKIKEAVQKSKESLETGNDKLLAYKLVVIALADMEDWLDRPPLKERIKNEFNW